MAAIPIYYVKGCADVPLGTDCNRLGTSRGFFNEIWVASACIARITGYSELLGQAALAPGGKATDIPT